MCTCRLNSCILSDSVLIIHVYTCTCRLNSCILSDSVIIIHVYTCTVFVLAKYMYVYM